MQRPSSPRRVLTRAQSLALTPVGFPAVAVVAVPGAAEPADPRIEKHAPDDHEDRIHGDADALVPAENGRRMPAVLERARARAQRIVLEGADPSFRKGEQRERASEARVAGLGRAPAAREVGAVGC